MQADQRSKTADAAAATRAAHRIYDRPVVFDDPYALDLTSPGWRRLCKSRLLHRLIVRNLMADLMPFGKNAVIRLEHGGENNTGEHYESVVYWYGRPAVTRRSLL